MITSEVISTRRLDRADDKRIGYAIIALAVLGLAANQCSGLPAIADNIIRCLCKSGGFEYGFQFQARPSDVRECSNEHRDHCNCEVNGDEIELDLPHVDWLDEEEQVVDLVCVKPGDRIKRDTTAADHEEEEEASDNEHAHHDEHDLDEATEDEESGEHDDSDHHENERKKRDTSANEPDKEKVVIKTNVLSRTISGAGSVVSGAGDLVGGGIQQIGSAAGSAVSGGFHLIGKVTRNITSFVGNSVKSVGNIFQGVKTIRERRSVSPQGFYDDYEPHRLKREVNRTWDLINDQDDDSDEVEFPGQWVELRLKRSVDPSGDTDESTEDSIGPATPNPNLDVRGEGDKPVNQGRVLISEKVKQPGQQLVINQFEEVADKFKQLADLFIKASRYLNDIDDIDEVRDKLYAEYEDPTVRLVIDEIITQTKKAGTQVETTPTDIIIRASSHEESNGPGSDQEEQDPSATNRTIWQRIKHVRSHLQSSDTALGFADRMVSDKSLDEFEKTFADRFKQSLSLQIGCGLKDKTAKATEWSTFADLETFLIDRLKICGAEEITRDILNLIHKIPGSKSRRKRSTEESGSQVSASKKKKKPPKKKTATTAAKAATEKPLTSKKKGKKAVKAKPKPAQTTETAEEAETQEEEHVEQEEEEEGHHGGTEVDAEEESAAVPCRCDPDTGSRLT